MVEKLLKANWSLEDSKNLVYERRYHKQYEKARAQFISDSSALSIYLDDFYRKYPFSKENQLWESYLLREKNNSTFKELNQNKQKIIQICRNRWTEGIFDISHQKIESNKVELNQGEVPDLTFV